MEAINSISKGVFVFKNDETKQKLRKKSPKPLNSNKVHQSGYELFSKHWKEIEDKIELIQSTSYEKILTGLLTFIQKIDFDETENLQTAILLTGVNQSDHLKQFKTLSLQISNNCSSRVAILQSRDGPNVKSALEVLVSEFIHQEDESLQLKKKQLTMPVLEAWYKHRFESDENKPKLVIMIADFEQFNTTCVQDLISILCCYSSRLPFVLVVGVATAFKTLHNVLPSHITNKMDVNIFQSDSSTVMLNKILEEVVLSHESPFQLSKKSFETLMDIFLFYDFSLNSFIKGYKIFFLEHCRKFPYDLMTRSNDEIETEVYGLNSSDCDNIRRSCQSFRLHVNREKNPQTRIDLIKNDETLKFRIISEVSKLRKYLHKFHCSLRILVELFDDLPKNDFGKLLRELYPICISSEVTAKEEFEKCFSLLRFTSKEKFLAILDRVFEILQKYLDEDLKKDLNKLQDCYKLISESGMKIVTVQDSPQSKSEIGKGFNDRQALMESLKNNSMQKQSHQVNEFEQRIIECLDYLKKFLIKNLRPIEAAPAFNEFFLFDDYKSVRDQILGAPRGVMHSALNNPHRSLHCSCCIQTETDQIIPKSFPDTSIGYKLHLENNKFINLFDWLQSFSMVTSSNEDDEEISPETQARFTRLVTELQFLGFIKSAKQKTDHVIRLTW